MTNYPSIKSIDLRATIEQMVHAIEMRDICALHHSAGVACLSEKLAIALNLDNAQVATIHTAAHLHDIGKVGIPDSILLKNGKYSDAEYQIMKEHVVIGYLILAEMEGLDDVAQIVLHHHERYEGSGYPHGLQGEDIPLGSRIIAIADAFDAMTSRRSYRRQFTIPEALTELLRQKGRQFDPDLVDVFVHRMIDDQ